MQQSAVFLQWNIKKIGKQQYKIWMKKFFSFFVVNSYFIVVTEKFF